MGNVSGHGLMWCFCLLVLIPIDFVLQTERVVMRLFKFTICFLNKGENGAALRHSGLSCSVFLLSD